MIPIEWFGLGKEMMVRDGTMKPPKGERRQTRQRKKWEVPFVFVVVN
jgi:hypothetical protein